VASTDFYEVARQSAKSAEVRTIMADLLKRSRKRDRLLAEFAEQVGANRTRREGKPYKPTRAAKELMCEADEAARKAAEARAQRLAQLSDEALLRLALSGWDLAVQAHNPASYHQDDREFAQRIDRHNKQALRLIKGFFRAQGIPIPALSSGGGISFIAAFKRAIPDLGTLGADCMAIEPALAVLDKIAEKASLDPLSRFVNQDPQGLSGKKPEWFDPAAGLSAVRGLLNDLGQSARAVKNGKQVIQDLKNIETYLIKAEQRKVRFHFVMLD
jgi:hypothetical protein